MPEDVDATFGLVREGEAQRQGILNTAGNIITGQEALEESRNKVPVTVAGKTFNVKPHQAAQFEMDKHKLETLAKQHGFENMMSFLDFARKSADSEVARNHYGWLHDDLEQKWEYQGKRMEYLDALIDKAGMTESSYGLDEQQKLGLIETKAILEPLATGGTVAPSYVAAFNQNSHQPYIYLPTADKGFWGGKAGYQRFSLPVINGKRLRAAEAAQIAELMGVQLPEAYKHIMIMANGGKGINLPDFNSGVEIVE